VKIMRYHNITKADMMNGEGLRVVLWASGCNHKCPGCHNQVTWDPSDGLLFDETAKEELLKELDQSYCEGITLSGGDPLYPLNRESIAKLVAEIREKYPTKTIWCYTGYTYEEIKKEVKQDKDLKTIMDQIDILVDGKFIVKNSFTDLKYIGSSNQRIIDMKKTRESGKVIIYLETENDEFNYEDIVVCHS